MTLINDHDQFLYKGDVETGQLFKKGEPIPEGWFDAPNATEWDNVPLPPDQWPVEQQPEPEPTPIISEPNYVEPEGRDAPISYRTVTPEEQAAPEPKVEQPDKFDPFPVTNEDLLKLKKHELVEILSLKKIDADATLHISQLRSLARKAYVK